MKILKISTLALTIIFSSNTFALHVGCSFGDGSSWFGTSNNASTIANMIMHCESQSGDVFVWQEIPVPGLCEVVPEICDENDEPIGSIEG